MVRRSGVKDGREAIGCARDKQCVEREEGREEWGVDDVAPRVVDGEERARVEAG